MSDEEKKKLEEIQRKAAEEEERRIEEEVAKRSEELSRLRKAKKKSVEETKEQIRLAEDNEIKRKQEEEKKRQDETRKKEEQEKLNREREKEAAEAKGKEEEERARQQAAREKEERKKQETEREKESAEAKRKEEEKKKFEQEDKQKKDAEESQQHGDAALPPGLIEVQPAPVSQEILAEKAAVEGAERKLAAIMFTDIKGFSKKMGENEAAAMQVLRTHDTMMRGVVTKYGGKVIKSIGDSFMVDFSSAVNAVKCSVEVQEEFWKYNQGKGDFEKIQIRIGIHLGDVVILGNDIFGDGVNIASRIEAITEPDRICISGDVYNQVKNKINLQAVSFGSVQLKNIAEPIEVFQILVESIPELAKPSRLVLEAQERRKRDSLAQKARETQRVDPEKRRAEEEARRAESAKRRAEEEAKRVEAAKKRTEEAKRDEERRKAEQEAKQKELKQQEEIHQALSAAQKFLEQKNYDEARQKTQSVLDIDPMRAEGLALFERIQTAQAETIAVQQAAEAEKQRELERIAHEQAEKEAAAAKIQEVAREKGHEVASTKKKRPIRVIVGVLTGVVVIVAGIILFQVTRPMFAEKRSLAVLPFVTNTSSEEQKVYGQSLAEETALLLARIPGVTVMGVNSAVNFRKFTPDTRRAVLYAGFSYTVQGRISIDDAGITISVELLDTVGSKQWFTSISQPRDKIAHIAPALASAIAQAIDVHLPSNASLSQQPGFTENAKAYLLYLQGRTRLHEGSANAARAAVQFFEGAIAADPQFAGAHAAIAHALFHTYERRWDEAPALLSRAEQFANKALSIQQGRTPQGEDLPEAHVVLGGILMLSKNYRPALNEFDKAMAAMPNNSEALRLAGTVYAMLGDEDGAVTKLSAAAALDPASPEILTSLAFAFERFDRPKEAMQQYNRILIFVTDTTTFLADVASNALTSAYEYDRVINVCERRVQLLSRSIVDQYRLARAYQLAGKDRTTWLNAFEKTIRLAEQQTGSSASGALASLYMGLAYSRSGRFPEGEKSGKKALELAPNDPIIQYKLAGLYSIQKKKTEAIATLQRAIANRYLLEEVSDLDLFNIHDEPEFQQTIVDRGR